uniref:Uncharacterized protein n=1 Tax=Romanomermis culicivorax TaxID=13658 RepID=A0A915IZ76_ROMCU
MIDAATQDLQFFCKEDLGQIDKYSFILENVRDFELKKIEAVAMIVDSAMEDSHYNGYNSLEKLTIASKSTIFDSKLLEFSTFGRRLSFMMASKDSEQEAVYTRFEKRSIMTMAVFRCDVLPTIFVFVIFPIFVVRLHATTTINSSLALNVDEKMTIDNNSTSKNREPNLFNLNKTDVDTFVKNAEMKLREIMKVPYMQSVVLPALIGITCALLTVIIVCCIRVCVRAQLKKRRKRRIRSLADELKSDKSMLADNSSDEEF